MKTALALLQISDSFFPTGMFAHSLGLEGMVRRARVRSLHDLEQLMLGMLTQSVIPSDGVALLNAHRAVGSEDLDVLCSVDSRLFLMKVSPELRTSSQQHGRRLLTETATFSDDRTLAEYRSRITSRGLPGMGAVVFGALSGALGIDTESALAGYVHGYMLSLTSAAIRLLPLSNTDCQLMMHRIQSAILERLDSIRDRPWREMTAFTPELDIVSMGHQNDDLRMFAS